MCKNEFDRLERILVDAIEHTADERSAFLESACDGDAALRARIESMLDVHSRAGGFMRVANGAADAGVWWFSVS